MLFSIHDEDVPVFRLLRMRARRMPGLIEDAKDVLLMLFDADAEYCADTLEDIYDELETVSRKVLAGERHRRHRRARCSRPLRATKTCRAASAAT